MLNITNGDYFNEYFKKNINPCALPFREALMQGCADPVIFSNEFILVRAKSLGVSKEEYLKNCRELLSAIDGLNSNGQVDLWFGDDTFCQLNLLTLLAYLEQKGYAGKVFLHLIDDETFEFIGDKIQVKLGCYTQIYNDVIIKRQRPKTLGVLNERAINLYFDYLSDGGFLAQTVLKNKEKSIQEIVVELLKISKEYGLSDLLAKELIQRVLGKK